MYFGGLKFNQDFIDEAWKNGKLIPQTDRVYIDSVARDCRNALVTISAFNSLMGDAPCEKFWGDICEVVAEAKNKIREVIVRYNDGYVTLP